MNRYSLKLMLLVIACVGGFSLANPVKASAASTWCGVLAPALNVSSPPSNNDCITYGQNYTAFTNADGSEWTGKTSDQLKALFINRMTTYESNPQSLMKTGVAYIESRIGNANMTWDTRIMQPDVTLYLDLNYSFTENSVYDTTTGTDHMVAESGKHPAIVFIVNGYSTFVVKTDCGNPLNSDILPGVQALPMIDGYKIANDQLGLNSPVSTDNITATWGAVTKSDSGQPFRFFITTANSKVTVSAANARAGYTVVGYNVQTCNIKQSTCSNTDIPAGTGTSVSWFTSYDYEYHMTWSYAVIQPATITGYKVDTAGNTIGPFSSDSISATNISAGGTVASTSDPFSFTVAPGSVNVTASNSVTDWVLVGYTSPCDSSTLGCINSPSNVALTNPNPTANINAASGHTYYVNWVYKPKTPVPPSDCPPFLNPIVTVALPDNSPSSGAPTGPASTRNTTYNQYTRLGTTRVTGVFDISTGGNRVIPTLVSPALNVTQSQNQAVLDYTPYVKAYPYDLNQPTVNYTNYYTVTPYISASTASGYTCPGGSTGPDANNKCTITTTSGGMHYTTGTPTTTNTVVVTYRCNPGDFGGGSSPTCVHFYTGGRGQPLYSYYTGTPVYSTTSVTTYTCPYPYSGGGTTSVCSYSDAATTTTLIDATPYYNYTAQPSYQASTNSTAAGTVMPACFPRGFSVTAVNSASANVSFNDAGNENPTSSTPSGYSATIKFSYTARKPEQGLRQIMKAKLQYSYKFYKNSKPNSATICAASNGFTATGNSNLSVGDGASTPDPFIIPTTACAVSVGAAATQLAPGDTICAIYTISPTGSTVDIQGNILTSNGGVIASSEKCSSPIVNKPYFKVFGGDVSVGGPFASALSCGSSVAGAGIFGWNTATNPVYAGHPNTGAGAQFATSNLNTSNLFASNQYNPNAGTPQSPFGLSFANVGATGNNFGVSLGSASCIPDFFSSKPASAAPITSSSLSGVNGTYYSAGDLTINPSDIGIGNHITIYVTGNVYIKGNINFNNNYSSINDIQSLIIIAKSGNIYIDKGVKSINGIFIAQPTSTSTANGYIYDCATGFSAIANNQLYDNCDTQLTVNGSFIANKVFLNRTGNATNDKLSSSLRSSYATETNAATNATEIFNYGPAFWMNLSLPQSTATGSSSAGYDSIVSLPPIL